MHVIVLGAGRIGQYVAQSLSQDKHSVILVDSDAARLEEANYKMDIATKKGSATDATLLASLMEDAPSLLLALTDDDESNLVACSIVKHLGQIRTICRLKESSYQQNDRVDMGRLFYVDHFVVPELIVSDQIAKIILNQGFYSESFFHGLVALRTLQIPETWKYPEKTLAELGLHHHNALLALISRSKKAVDKSKKHLNIPFATRDDTIIFPHGQDVVMPGDEITVIGESDSVYKLSEFFGIDDVMPSSVLICGGTLVGAHLAETLSKKGISIRLIDPSLEGCTRYSQEMPRVSILHQESIDYELLRQERVGLASVFVACTPYEDKNILLGLFAKELGCKKVIAVLSSEASCRLADKLEIAHVISVRIATTDRIISLSRRDKVASKVSLYDRRAEVVEVRVSEDSPILGIPLSILGPRLPHDLLFGVIYNRGRTFVARGSHILSPNDQVIVISSPKEREFLEKIF